METTFKEIISTDAYQKAATNFCKSIIFVSVLTVISIHFTSSSSTIISSALLFFGWGLFGVSIFVALPIFMLNIFVIGKMSSHTEYPSGKPSDTIGRILKTLSTLLILGSYLIAVISTIYVAKLFGI